MAPDPWADTRAEHRAQQARRIAETALRLAMDGGAAALTMAGIAGAAGISRQTLYRYYPDLDAVMRGIADMLGSVDDDLARLAAEAATPSAGFAALAVAVAREADHPHHAVAALLPPAAREVLAAHAERTIAVMTDVLRRGVADGSFRPDLDPATDAPLLLALLAAADPARAGRAVALATELVHDPNEMKEHR